MTAVDSKIQRKLKFKITSKGIQGVPDKKPCQDIPFLNIKHGLAGKLSVKSCVSANTIKRKPEAFLDGEKEKKQKMDHSMKQRCLNILKTLMIHPVGCYFSEPVDPVKLNIPDYFSVVTKPMDLGTIKSKLEGESGYGVSEFFADVRLTFSNAMLYNPPGNCFHKFAKELDEIFCRRWRTLESKLKSVCNIVEQDNFFDGMRKNGQDSCQTIRPNGIDSPKIVLKKVARGADLVNRRPMPLEEKRNLRLQLQELSSRKMIKNIQSAFEKFGLIDLSKEGLNSFINGAKDETLWKLKTEIICFSDAGAVKVDPVKISPSGYLGLNKAVGKAKCSCGCMACHCKPQIVSAQTTSNDITSERSSELYQYIDSKFDCKEMRALTSHSNELCQDRDGLRITAEGDSPLFSTSESASSGEGWMSTIIQMSPKKALRAAMLKSRFADTIFRARQQTLVDHGEKSDPIKIQQEKEILIKQQLEEKTRIEAEIKAVEDASRMRREKEREAARMAIQKLEKTVDLNENLEILKFIEMLNQDSGSDFPGCGTIQGSHHGNLLERLGLYIKEDYFEEDEIGNMSEEEGEILS